MTIHNLFFDGTMGKRKIGEVSCEPVAAEDVDQEVVKMAMSTIQRFCEERNFHIHYTRIWNEEGVTVFDVGSHTEFFLLEPGVGSIV